MSGDLDVTTIDLLFEDLQGLARFADLLSGRGAEFELGELATTVDDEELKLSIEMARVPEEESYKVALLTDQARSLGGRLSRNAPQPEMENWSGFFSERLVFTSTSVQGSLDLAKGLKDAAPGGVILSEEDRVELYLRASTQPGLDRQLDAARAVAQGMEGVHEAGRMRFHGRKSYLHAELVFEQDILSYANRIAGALLKEGGAIKVRPVELEGKRMIEIEFRSSSRADLNSEYLVGLEETGAEASVGRWGR